MLTWTLLVVFLGLLFWICRKPSGLPPGKWGLPVIGYIPLYTNNGNRIVSDLKNKYGDIFTWKLGGQVMVGLCDYQLIKNTFNRPECQGRPYIYTFLVLRYHANAGIISSDGEVWVRGRRFALRHLKDFGMGRSSMETAIQYEAVSLAENFAKTAGKPTEISWSLNVAVLNVLWKLVADQRYDITDKEIIKFNALVRSNIDTVQSKCMILDIFPRLHKFLPKLILDKVFNVNVLYDNLDEFCSFIMKVVKQHEETLDPSNPRDYIDAYLLEFHKDKDPNDNDFEKNYLDLVISLGDLFVAGSETTSSTIRWLIAILANHPDIQRKCQDEIDSVVPRDTPPSLQDKEKLPYTEAVLLEVMRYSSFVPLGVMHATTEDIKVGDYHLPKDTTIFASARSCHMDPKYFEKPEEFYPEHFLDKDGKVLSKKEGFLPFSLGRRQCLGENLARMELFLFASCLIQKFTISPPEGGKIPLETDPFQPLLCFILPYEAVFTERK